MRRAEHVSLACFCTALLHCRVNWLLLILTLRFRRRLPLPDGSATLAPCFTCFFRRPFVRHAAKMREFPAFTRDFALSVAVHGRESALACRHLTSVVAAAVLHCACQCGAFCAECVKTIACYRKRAVPNSPRASAVSSNRDRDHTPRPDCGCALDVARGRPDRRRSLPDSLPRRLISRGVGRGACLPCGT
jgi:hypothetical protein